MVKASMRRQVSAASDFVPAQFVSLTWICKNNRLIGAGTSLSTHNLGEDLMAATTYTLPIDESKWDILSAGITTTFSWQYADGREKLLNLYEKGKTKQWNSNERLDWSAEVDKSNPLGFPDYYVSIYGSEIRFKVLCRDSGIRRGPTR